MRHPDRLRAEGNELFRKGRLDAALAKYGECLHEDPKNALAHSNKAAVYLHLQKWREAWWAAKQASELDPDHIKSLYRRGYALLMLCCYDSAVSFLRDAHGREEGDRDIRAAMDLAEELQRESCGNYKSDKLYWSTDHVFADYAGPLEISHIPGRGRGVRVTEDVKVGELLAVESPLALAEAAGAGEKQELREDETGFDALVDQAHLDVVNALRGRYRQDRRAAARVACLYDGTPASTAQLPSISTFKPCVLEEELEAEAHASGSTGGGAAPLPDLDAARLSRICHYNAWEGDADTEAVTEDERASKGAGARYCGLWALLSLLNHSCAPNVSVVSIGYTRFVRAARDLVRGEELLDCYCPALLHSPAEERRRFLRDGWEFDCACARCAAEAGLPEPAAALAGQLAAAVEPEGEPPGDLLAQFRQASEDDDPAQSGMRAVQERCRALVDEYEAALRGAGLAEAGPEVHWCRGSVYGAYEVQYSAARQLKDMAAVLEVGRLLRDIDGAVAPGSGMHAKQACLHAEDAMILCGTAADSAQEAVKAARAALCARYGQVAADMADVSYTASHPGGPDAAMQEVAKTLRQVRRHLDEVKAAEGVKLRQDWQMPFFMGSSEEGAI